MRPRGRYALLGILLGFGAPLGSLLLRSICSPTWEPLSTLIQEWHSAAYYYVYMTLGTTIAFGLFGSVLGKWNEDLGDLSVTDGLTGIYNHRHLQEQLDREIERSDRYATPVTCLMLDIDDFKKINDWHGHPFGDTVLQQTAKIIHDGVRRTDTVGRYGGEEFLVVMPSTETGVAHALAERIVAAVRDHSFVFKGKVDVRITVSVGMATYPAPEHGIRSKNAFLSATDQALYRAKHAGKNQVVIWQA